MHVVIDNRDSIGVWMQSDEKTVNHIENIDMISVRLLCVLDQFVPECTEVIPLPRRSTTNVKFCKCPHKIRHKATILVMNGLVRDVDQGAK